MPTEHMPYTPYKPPPVAKAPAGKTHIQTALTTQTPALDPYLRPLTPAQIQAQASTAVRSQVDPLIGQITQAIQARSKAGSNAIGAYTGQLQSALAPMAGQTQAAYTGAGTALAGMSQALADRLAAAGQGLTAQTSGALTAAGQDTAPADRATAFGNGAAAASQAGGNADAAALQTQGLAATDYARALPGIAGLGGIQQAGNLQSQLGADLATQTGQVTAQVPGLIQSVLSSIRGNETSKANARQSATNAQNANLTAQDRIAATNRNNAINLVLKNGGVDPTTGGLTKPAQTLLERLTGAPAGSFAGVNPKDAPKYSAAVSKSLGFRADQFGHPIDGTVTPLPGYSVTGSGTVDKTPKPIKPPKPPLPINRALISDATKQARALATTTAPKQHYVAGVPSDVPGTGKTAARYNDALTQIVALGPDTPAWRKKAQQIVDAQYAPGENGRPWGAAAATTAAQTVRVAAQNGLTIAEARQKMLEAGLPGDVIDKAIRAYKGAWLPLQGK